MEAHRNRLLKIHRGLTMGGSIGGIVGGIIGGDAADDAADAQLAAADKAAKVQWDMYDQNRQDQMPWLSMGTGALNQLGYLLGINPVDVQMQQAIQSQPGTTNNTASTQQTGGAFLYPELGNYGPYSPNWQILAQQNNANNNAASGGTNTGNANLPNPMANPYSGINQGMGARGSLSKSFGMSDFQADPGYAFRMAEGQKALERSAAAKGGLMSGAAGKAMARYGQDMASQEYQNAYNRYNTNQTNLYNRLASVAGVGQTSANALGNYGQNTANNVSDTALQAGNAAAAGRVGSANAWQSGLAGIGQSIGGMFGGGGGGGRNYIDASSSLPWL